MIDLLEITFLCHDNDKNKRSNDDYMDESTRTEELLRSY